MLSRIAFVSSVLLLTLACGGPGSFKGEVAGNELPVEDSAFLAWKDDQGAILGASVVLADVPEICTTLKANRLPKNATFVSFSVFRSQGTGLDRTYLSPDKGTYSVVPFELGVEPPANFAWAFFTKNDANCTNIVASDRADGQSGTVEVESIEFEEGKKMTGTFDVTFGTQNDKVTGDFNAEFCDVPPIGGEPNCE